MYKVGIIDYSVVSGEFGEGRDSGVKGGKK
jgi:hypothetical protein